MTVRVSAGDLDRVMSFDRVIEVHGDGTVSDHSAYAPEVIEYLGDDGKTHVSVSPESWTLMSGYSGQYCYSGPVMHPSEFIGGAMARDILSEPGWYVAVVVPFLDDDADAGWAVAFAERV